VGVFSAVALVALVCGIRRTRKTNGRWSIAAIYGAFAVIVTFSIVSTLVTYTDSWVEVTDVYRAVTYSIPHWGVLVLRLLMIVTALGGLLLVVGGLRRPGAEVNIAAVLYVTVLVISMLSATQHGDKPLNKFSLIYLCILAGCVFAPRGWTVHFGIATVAMFTALAGGLALIVHPDFSAVACKAGSKCGVLGFNFQGTLDNENAIALYLALAIPFVYIAFRGWEGLVMVTYMAFLIALTGSRSGLLTAVITVGVLVLARPDIGRPARTPVRSTLLAIGLAGTVAVGLLLPYVVTDPAALTGRSQLWQIARGELSDPATLVYGAGMFGWAHVHERGLIDASAVYSVHNLWLQVLFATGLIGFACFLGVLAALFWQSRNGYFLVVGCVLTPVFVLAATERPWPLDTADWLTWAVTGALLCYPLTRPDTGDAAPAKAVAAEPVHTPEEVPT
jgi:O-antigen ligase